MPLAKPIFLTLLFSAVAVLALSGWRLVVDSDAGLKGQRVVSHTITIPVEIIEAGEAPAVKVVSVNR